VPLDTIAALWHGFETSKRRPPESIFWGRRRNVGNFASSYLSTSTKKKKNFSYGIRGLVIDPYNELDHQRPSNVSETEYVSQMLTKIKRFAQHYDVATWFVCHPKQMQNWTGGAPNLYDISGSAHFVNKADVGLVVHRVRDELAQQQNPGGQSNDKVREEEGEEEEERERSERARQASSSLTFLFFIPFDNYTSSSFLGSNHPSQGSKQGCWHDWWVNWVDSGTRRIGVLRATSCVFFFARPTGDKTHLAFPSSSPLSKTKKTGECYLNYDRATGRYEDVSPAEASAFAASIAMGGGQQRGGNGGGGGGGRGGGGGGRGAGGGFPRHSAA